MGNTASIPPTAAGTSSSSATNAKSVIENAVELSNTIDAAGAENYDVVMQSMINFAEKKLEKQRALLVTLRSLNL